MSAPPGLRADSDLAAPRRKKGILTPATENTLNVGNNTTGTLKKRKWSFGALEESLEDPFHIRTLPSSAPDEVRKLTPILLLPRSHLPLAFLNPEPRSTLISTGRLFSAHIRALEHRDADHPHRALVMVAALEAEGSLYAVERVRCGLYALCRLGDWVKVEALHAAALAARDYSTSAKHKPLDISGGNSWWEGAAIRPFYVENSLRAKRVRARPSGSIQLKMRSALSQTPPKASQCRKTAVLPVPDAVTAAPEPVPSGLSEQRCGVDISVEEIFETLRCQYLEALYLSKTSLAYFAKGPLSRVRATFQTEQKAPKPVSDLTEFLRSSVLTLAVFDKKYRESVPQVIQSLPLGDLSNEEDNAGSQVANKRKQKKMRLSKGGLYPREDDYIRRWWRAREVDLHRATPDEQRDEEAKRLIVDLKTRETQMQLVVVLEVLALESSSTEAVSHNEACKQRAQVRDEERILAKKRRPKSRQDLNLLLELLTDRLTIWQSVSLPEEISRTSASTGMINSQHHVRIGHNVASATHENNERLREFCVEVIVPFYAARLPETCSTLNQRLGGVKVPSPARPPMLKSASTSHGLMRPGTVIKRTVCQQPQEPLKREPGFKKPPSRKPQQPSLLRSATAPALPGLKRESSDVSLSDIPLKRPSVEKSKRYSQREVDLSAISNATEAKLKRKAVLEEELRGAIVMLKKPNRSLAVKELNESFEQRVPGIGTSSRKPKHPIRNPFGQGVQVMATPKGNRRKNVFSRAPVVPREPSPDLREVPHAIPPADLHIPSSVTRPTATRRLPRSEFHVPQNPPHPVRRTLLSTVLQTPSRGPSRSIDVLANPQFSREEDELAQEMSPRPQRPRTFHKPREASERESGRSQFITAPVSSVQPRTTLPETTHTSSTLLSPSKGVAATPLKPSRNEPSDSGVAWNCQKILQESHELEGSKTIYESLGWDDDTDDLL